MFSGTSNKCHFRAGWTLAGATNGRDHVVFYPTGQHMLTRDILRSSCQRLGDRTYTRDPTRLKLTTQHSTTRPRLLIMSNPRHISSPTHSIVHKPDWKVAQDSRFSSPSSRSARQRLRSDSELPELQHLTRAHRLQLASLLEALYCALAVGGRSSSASGLAPEAARGRTTRWRQRPTWFLRAR